MEGEQGRNNIEHGHLMEKGEGNKRKEGTLEKNNAGKDLYDSGKLIRFAHRVQNFKMPEEF